LNDYVLALLLGIIEGLTEFLPVSSTAHLRIAEAALGVDLTSGYWKMFTIVIQLGPILCLPIYFRQRILSFLKTFPKGARGDRTELTHPLTLVLLAFLFTAGPAFLLTKIIGKNLESIVVMGTSLIVGGVLMWVIDVLYERGFFFPGRRTEDLEQVNPGQSIFIGLAQVAAAVFPGVSRSMATIAAGQLSGMSRTSALEFSFFLSIPTMAAATLYDLLKSLRHKAGEHAMGAAPQSAEQWIALLIGFVVSFIVAYAVVAWFMSWVRKRGFVPFAIYRILFGIIVLAWALNQ
jgi:undecaprenyl-diphosphatase